MKQKVPGRMSSNVTVERNECTKNGERFSYKSVNGSKDYGQEQRGCSKKLPMTISEYLIAEGYQSTPGLQEWIAKVEKEVPIEVQAQLVRRDGAAQLVERLPKIIPLSDVARPEGEGVWQHCGYFYFHLRRYNEALGVFSAMYDQMLAYQLQMKHRIHKGMPLVRMSECHSNLKRPALAKRYLMLTACEDAISGEGHIDPGKTGIYFRLVWERGFSHRLLDRYAREVWKIAQKQPRESLFPEWLVQELDQDWMIEFPSVEESGLYFATIPYLNWLLGKLGSGRGSFWRDSRTILSR
jgi:hypothetical protein